MKRFMKLNLWLLAGAPVSSALAQSYEIAWGSQGVAVPLSPWGNALIALVLTMAAFAYLRKRSGRGLFALLVALGIGLGTLNSDTLATFFSTGLTIGSQSGQATVPCSGDAQYVETTVPGGVTLTSVQAIGFLPAIAHVDECHAGSHLIPGDPGSGPDYAGCVLSCDQPPI